jgi:hypothetical protein
MEERTADNTPSVKGHSLVWWFIVFGACGFVSLAVLLGILAGPDQVRFVSGPSHTVRVLSSANASDLPQGPEGQEGSLPGEQTAGAGNDSFPQGSLLSELQPVPDISKLPEPLQRAGREWNQATEELVSDLLALAANAGSLSHEEAREEWLRLQKARYVLSVSFYQEVDAFVSKHGTREDINSQVPSTQDEWSNLATHTLLEVSIAHEDWMNAGLMCWGLGGGGPTHDSVWWDHEVYYLQKAGLRGRAQLAFRSAMPLAFRTMKRFNPELRKHDRG